MFVQLNPRQLAALALAVVLASPAFAAPPWSKLIPFQRVEANTDKSYELTQENGPWMVMAASFTGSGAEKDARALVLELRSEYGLEAYTYHQKYDFTDTVVGKGYDRYGNPKKMRYMNDTTYTSYAVLVGNFPSVEDAGLQKALDKIKVAQPQVFNNGITVKQDAIKSIRRRFKEAMQSAEDQEKGPMGNAFVSRNPLLPEEFFRPKGVDALVLQMNKDTPYSLLQCPGKFSVRVATFRGAVEIDQKKIEKSEEKAIVSGSRLAKAAEKAEKLAAGLRKQGVEAYSFHDRFESIVTVGSFESVGTPRRDGKIEINPQVLRTIEGYKGGVQTNAGPNGLTGYQPKSLLGIAFDVQPVPIEVPQVSIAADYARRTSR